MSQNQTKPIGIVVSGFPGIGKSYFASHSDLLVSDSDSDSSGFEKSGFTEKYVAAIKERQQTFDIVLASSHENVRAEMERQKVFYYLVFPDHDCYPEYVKRYRNRGSSEAFIDLVTDKWSYWIESCVYDGSGDVNELRSLNAYKLGKGRYLNDVIPSILGFELRRLTKYKTVDDRSQKRTRVADKVQAAFDLLSSITEKTMWEIDVPLSELVEVLDALENFNASVNVP